MPTKLTDAQIQEQLAALPGWEINADGRLSRTFQFGSYLDGVAFASAVGVVCEGIGHHPDLFIGWRRVVVSFITHDIGNAISDSDFEAAAAVAALGFPR
jgi:4a-hydroxytetrahydrobiopterin dehydratase